MKSIQKRLKNESGKEQNRMIKSVWFNAWKYSETDSMLAALVLEILEEMGRAGFGGKVNAMKIGGGKINKVKAFSDLAKILSSGLTPEFDTWLEDPAYKENLSFYDTFTDYMSKILSSFVLGEEGNYSEEKGILVIFIDDLDRCHPRKISQVFESINLFLDIKGCFFILGADISLISDAIKQDYENFSGRDYIKKMIQLQFDLPLIAEKDIKNFIEKELRIEEDYSDILVKGLEHNQRDIKRFINILNLMKNIGDSIEEFEYDEELLLKWSILNFSSEDFINHVKINNKIIIDMQKISKMRTEEEIDGYIETLDAPFKEIYLRFKDEKYLEILKSGNKEFKEKDIRNYVFLGSLASKEPIEYFADNKELADSFILKTTSFFREKDQQRLRKETGLTGKKLYDIRAIIDSSIPLALKNVVLVKYYLNPTYPRDKQIQVRNNYRDKFLLKELAWGGYMLKVKIYLKGEEEKPIERQEFLMLKEHGERL